MLCVSVCDRVLLFLLLIRHLEIWRMGLGADGWAACTVLCCSTLVTIIALRLPPHVISPCCYQMPRQYSRNFCVRYS